MGEMDEILQEFLLESHEALEQLDRDFVELSDDPADREILASVFGKVRTIKGMCGLLAFEKLEAVTHVGENLLGLLRDGSMVLDEDITNALLKMVDVVREILGNIESTGGEGDGDYTDLVSTLSELLRRPSSEAEEEVHSPDAHIAREVFASVAGVGTVPGDPDASGDIRIHAGLLDRLMTLVGDLVLARNQVIRHTAGIDDSALASASLRLDQITTELQEGVLKARTQAIATVWSRFPRMVRDLARQHGKKIRLETEGKETELDKTLIEAIQHSLTHVVRNSIDHGMESPRHRAAVGKPEEGVLTLRAMQEGAMTIIEIEDDGAGIDPTEVRRKASEDELIPADRLDAMSDREVLGLIFHPGYSTGEDGTSVSGRGAGMDMVRADIEKVGGSVEVASVLGERTTLRIRIPALAAILPALMVKAADERFAIPQSNLGELVRAEAEGGRLPLEFLHGAPVYRLRNSLLPLVDLAEQLGFTGTLTKLLAVQEIDADLVVNIVVVETEGCRFGLVVESMHDTADIVVEAPGRHFQDLGVYAGATIAPDGRISLILDVAGIARKAGLNGDLTQLKEESAVDGGPTSNTAPLLLVDSLRGDRLAIALADVARLEEIPVEDVELVGSQRVVQYRDEIMPLLDVCDMLPERRGETRGTPPARADSDLLQVVVLAEGGRSVGLVFAGIIDIVETDLSIRKEAARDFVRYSAVVRDRVTEVLDVSEIIRAGDPRRTMQADFASAGV